MRYSVRQNLLPFRSASFISPWLKLPSLKHESYKNRNQILMLVIITRCNVFYVLTNIWEEYTVLSPSVVKSREEITCTLFPEVGRNTKLHGVIADATVLQCIPTHTIRCYITTSIWSMHSFWTAWHLKMEPTVCPETWVTKYHPNRRNIPEQRKPCLHRGGSLQSHMPVSCRSHPVYRMTLSVTQNEYCQIFFGEC